MNESLFMDDSEFIDRPRGILTKQQREHLMGLLNEDPNEDTDKIRMRNHRIREHIRHSLLDFQLLSGVFDEVDMVEEALEPAAGSNPYDPDDVELALALESVFSVLYRALGACDPTKSQAAFDHLLNSGVSDALRRMYVKQGKSVNPNRIALAADIGEVVPLEELEERYDQGDYIHINELRELYWAGCISSAELQSAIDSIPKRPELAEEHGDEEARRQISDRAKIRERQRQEAAVAEINGLSEFFAPDERTNNE
jgi:hypothetical protein